MDILTALLVESCASSHDSTVGWYSKDLGFNVLGNIVCEVKDFPSFVEMYNTGLTASANIT